MSDTAVPATDALPIDTRDTDAAPVTDVADLLEDANTADTPRRKSRAELAAEVEALRAEVARLRAGEEPVAQTPNAAQRTLNLIRQARTWVEVWMHLGIYYGMKPEEAALEARARRMEAER
ncbi:hypothetical protein [Streptomyces sp. NPDC005096]|uniref:hypothetical protein n=1 Tax=Streptomyces sp. NPDC005096 TaxID=3154559 RepID=UPI0033B1C9C9